MLLLGIDVGTSSIKVAIVDANTQQCIASAQYPETESPVISPQPGWAEQSPETWWDHVQKAIMKVNATGNYNPKDIAAIGIAYQMHGLVTLDKNHQPLRNAIIWCDSRAVPVGEKALQAIGEKKALTHLLNGPGNFTASKLAWVKENEPQVYEQIEKIMLPGDFIAMKLTGEMTTSVSALSEGIFWDFKEERLSEDVFNYFGFDKKIIPTIKPLFSSHGLLKSDIAFALSLKAGIPVSYKAGDQPNNALSLNVLEPGEVAATAGTSGVIYGVSDTLTYDPLSRVNTFAHVNYCSQHIRTGVLLCINGTGILNQWTKSNITNSMGYSEINELAATVNPGSDELYVLPFGNGAERMLGNKIIGAHFQNIDFNRHTKAHLLRAVQEGIAYSFRYGLDIMRSNGMQPSVIRAGRANLFQSDLFVDAFVNATNVPVELYACDGSVGAAIGAGMGCGIYANAKEAFQHMKLLKLVEPMNPGLFNTFYLEWKQYLERQLS